MLISLFITPILVIGQVPENWSFGYPKINPRDAIVFDDFSKWTSMDCTLK